MILRGLIDKQDSREIRRAALKLLRDTRPDTRLLVSMVAVGEAAQGLLIDTQRDGPERFAAAMGELSRLHRRNEIEFCWIEQGDKKTYGLAAKLLDVSSPTRMP